MCRVPNFETKEAMEISAMKKSKRTLVLVLINLLFIAMVDANSRLHIVYMGERQHNDPELVTAFHHDLLASVVGSKEAAYDAMVYSYKHGFSGFAAKLTESQAQKIAEIPGVVDVVPNGFHTLQTTRSWDYLGLSLCDPTNLLYDSNMGDGVIIGVLDSGVWPESEMFSDKDLGPIPSRWKGRCDSGDQFNATTDCNRKLIGARWFIDGFLAQNRTFNTSDYPEFLSPRDAGGHGTHVSATAAGSFVGNANFKGLAQGIARGGAPRARLAVYKVCWNVPGSHCADADIIKGFDEAMHDGVDVLSVSLGSRSYLPNMIAEASFHAVMKGIPVVCAAGNSGPAAQTVGNAAPWILTVAASTMDRSFPTQITLGNNETIVGQDIFTGKEIGFTGLVFPNSSSVCDRLTLNGISVVGKVVLCFISGATRMPVFNASIVVEAAGGVGVIVAKIPSDVMESCINNFPCITVDYELGTKIMSYIRSTSSPMVKLSPSRTLIGKPVSTKIARFSSRGPSANEPAILKPDIAAPGVNVLAASSPVDTIFTVGGFSLKSGTSMATPHVSGIVALLKALHPNWSPAAIKSAIVTTARKTDPSGEPISADGDPQKPSDPFDYGGGIVNPHKVAYPGLVYDMDKDDYIHYLCAVGYTNSDIFKLIGQSTMCPTPQLSILDLNLPSITIPSLKDCVTVTRKVKNVGPLDSIYKPLIEAPLGIHVAVKPDVLVFNCTTNTIIYKVEVSTTHRVNTGYLFGSLSWTDGVHLVTSPISVRTQIIPFYTDEN